MQIIQIIKQIIVLLAILSVYSLFPKVDIEQPLVTGGFYSADDDLAKMPKLEKASTLVRQEGSKQTNESNGNLPIGYDHANEER